MSTPPKLQPIYLHGCWPDAPAESTGLLTPFYTSLRRGKPLGVRRLGTTVPQVPLELALPLTGGAPPAFEQLSTTGKIASVVTTQTPGRAAKLLALVSLDGNGALLPCLVQNLLPEDATPGIAVRFVGGENTSLGEVPLVVEPVEERYFLRYTGKDQAQATQPASSKTDSSPEDDEEWEEVEEIIEIIEEEYEEDEDGEAPSGKPSSKPTSSTEKPPYLD